MIRRLTFGLLWIAAPATLFAGVGVWTTNGPQGGAASGLVDPSGIVYAAMWGSEPRPMGNCVIPYTGSLARSNDAGATWQFLSVMASPLAAGPAGTVYAAFVLVSGPCVPNLPVNLYRSTDGGANWTVIVQKVATNFSVTVDPFQPLTIFRTDVGPDGGSLWRSNDQGSSWTAIGQGLGLGPSTAISAFAADPKTPNVYYAVTGPAGFYRTTDGGDNWTRLANTVLPGTATALAVDHLSSSIYAGIVDPTGGGTLGLLKSVDGGSTFQQIYGIGGGAFALDPVRPNQVYLATSAGGVPDVLVSADGGATWASMGLPQSITGLAVDPLGRFLYAAAPNAGVYEYQLNSSTCAADSHTLCLSAGRFAVTADFQTTSEGPATPATAVPLTAETGYFWFFDPANIELVTKVLDGCSTNGHYWVFASGLTNVGVQITVTDTVTGASEPYSNPVRSPFPPIQDTAAFPCP